MFSRSVPVHGKASQCRLSHSKASCDNEVRGRAHCDRSFKINGQGQTYPGQLHVVAFVNGMTINCKPRLDLNGIRLPEHNLLGGRVNNNYPWWRGEVRRRQIRQMLSAKNIEALIFAYFDDEYNRPLDLQFLIDHDPDSVIIESYRCDYPYTHNTHLHDCRHQQTKSLIFNYIHSQIWGFNET